MPPEAALGYPAKEKGGLREVMIRGWGEGVKGRRNSRGDASEKLALWHLQHWCCSLLNSQKTLKKCKQTHQELISF